MMRPPFLVLLGLCGACHSTPPTDPGSSPTASSSAGASPSATIPADGALPAAAIGSPRSPLEASLSRNYCGTGIGGHLYALEDGKGTLGGYSYSPPIPDSPVTYLDADGVVMGSFHIFSQPQTTEKVPGSIAKLQKGYPQGRLVCATP